MSAQNWSVIVLAGQRPGKDPLAQAFGQDLKALVEIAGVPMLTRVLKTVHALPNLGRVVVVSQDPERLSDAVAGGGGAKLAASFGGISESILAVAGSKDAPWPILVTTADHPLLDLAMLTEFLTSAANVDIAVGMVERATLVARFPNSRRTWFKLADGDWSGANLFALGSERARIALKLWAEAEQDRKKVWKLFLHFGPWLALRALTRTIGMRDGLAAAGKRLAITARLVPLSDSVACIDVDKPADHALAELILKQREMADL